MTAVTAHMYAGSSFDLVSSHMNEEDHKQEINTYCENIKIKLETHFLFVISQIHIF